MKKQKRYRRDFRVFNSRNMVKVPLDLMEKIIKNTQEFGEMGEILELPYSSKVSFSNADFRGFKIRIARAKKENK